MISFFSFKNQQFDSYIERGKFLMAYRLTFIFAVVFLGMSIIFSFQDVYSFVGYLAAFLISFLSLVYLKLSIKYRPIFMFFGIAGTVLAQYAVNFSHQTPHYVDFLWMIVASFLAFIGLGRKWGLTILLANALLSFWFIFKTHNKHIEILQPFDFKFALITYVEIILAFFAIGYLMYQFILFQNYSENKLQKVNYELNNQNELILAKSNENIVLIKEIHHRVKNNLQIIISLLRLQQDEIKNQETKEQFTEAINRVMVMSSIHQRLYQEKEIARIDLKSYLTDMANDLKKIFQNEKDVIVKVESSFAEIDLKTVVPLGLLLNELISNSYKYAFTQQNNGLINIRINEISTGFTLHYSDNGKWKNQKENSSGFGLDLIKIFTEQLNGKCIFETDNSGTHYWFEFEKTD